MESTGNTGTMMEMLGQFTSYTFDRIVLCFETVIIICISFSFSFSCPFFNVFEPLITNPELLIELSYLLKYY